MTGLKDTVSGSVAPVDRLAQLIANAADKELGTRVLTDGQPRRQDKAAALAIEAEYLFIRRDEMPSAEIVDRDGVPHVDVGSDAGTWSCKTSSAAYARKTGLEYLAVSIAIDDWHGERLALQDKTAMEYFGLAYEYLNNVSDGAKAAVDRIIELERNAA